MELRDEEDVENLYNVAKNAQARIADLEGALMDSNQVLLGGGHHSINDYNCPDGPGGEGCYGCDNAKRRNQQWDKNKALLGGRK